jgi:uncharacterized protein YdaU (DUF1376 family)
MGKPYMPLMMGDWVRGTRGMTAQVKGVYIGLLIHQYDHGFIPSDIKTINLIEPEAQKVWHFLAEKFEEIEPGKLQNKKLEEVRRFWNKQSKNGSKGGRPSKNKNPNINPNKNPNINPNENPKHNHHIDIDNYIIIDGEVIKDLMPILETYEAALNGRQKEYKGLNWRLLVPVWFRLNNGMEFSDYKHVFNTFSKYYIANKDYKPELSEEQKEAMRILDNAKFHYKALTLEEWEEKYKVYFNMPGFLKHFPDYGK